MPVSLTSKCMFSCPDNIGFERCTPINTSPLLVNFIALPTRFIKTCRRRCMSPTICDGTSWSISYTRSISVFNAEPANTSNTSSIQVRRSKSAFSSSMFPDSILEKSRISLITDIRLSPQLLIAFAYSPCSSVSSVLDNNEDIPITPFKGVRISWLIVARNTLLALFACSASSLAFSSFCLANFSCSIDWPN